MQVSVVIPVRGDGATLDRALRSVTAQTQPVAEVVVVVDGGPTPPLASGLGLRLRVIRQQPLGAAAARNHGLRASTSPWVAFLDADDEWHPGKVAAMCAALARTPQHRVAYSDELIVADGRPIGRWSQWHPPAEGHVLGRLLIRNVIQTSTVMVHREAVDAAGGFDESFVAWEDCDLWLRLSRRETFAYVDAVLGTYHRSGGSLSTRLGHMAEGRLRSIQAALSWPEVQALPKSMVAGALAGAWWDCCTSAYLAGTDRPARAFARQAIKADPRLILQPRVMRLYGQTYLPPDLRARLRQRRRS